MFSIIGSFKGIPKKVLESERDRLLKTFNLDKSIENGMEVAKENSIAVEEAENSVYIPLYENESRKLYISFYLEGWDLDNTNITMFAYFTINISFMIANSRA